MVVPAAVYRLVDVWTGFMAILYGRRLINKETLGFDELLGWVAASAKISLS